MDKKGGRQPPARVMGGGGNHTLKGRLDLRQDSGERVERIHQNNQSPYMKSSGQVPRAEMASKVTPGPRETSDEG